MVGHTTHRSCSIWVYAGEGANMTLRYRPADEPRAAWKSVAVSPRPERRFSAVATLDGLAPQTTYAYRIDIDGREEAVSSFTTGPLPHRPARFNYVVTSCMDVTLYPEQPAWDAVGAQQPDFHQLIGDNVYANSTDRDVLWRYHLNQRAVPNFARLLASVPSYATWDDHDYGPNDSHGQTPGKEHSLKAFKDLWANPSFGAPDLPGVFYSYHWANVHFIILDNRYYRTDEHTDNVPGKTQFGEAQRAWLFEQLSGSRSPFKVIVTGYDIMGARYPEEIGIIARYIRENGIYGVLFHTGDIHRNEFKQQQHGMGYPVTQITSSGIAKNDERPWAMVDADTTLDDPTLNARFFSRESLQDSKEVKLSMLTPPGVSDLILHAPGAGEILTAGTTHTIAWTRVGNGIGQVSLAYNPGSGWRTISSAVPNTGSFRWQVPDVPASAATVRVTSEDGKVVDEGRGPFVIQPAP